MADWIKKGKNGKATKRADKTSPVDAKKNAARKSRLPYKSRKG